MTEMKSEFRAAGFHPRRKARATQSVADKDRRAFLRMAMAQGVAAPAALAALQCPVLAAQPPVAPEKSGQEQPGSARRKGAMRHSTAHRSELHASGSIVRDFADPQLELLRLLREAAEIEHALMLQYLFAAFSLRETYVDLAGYGSAEADNVIGVAIQEMQHLAAVNHLLVALGSCPHLDRQDFPYEPDIYPFAFELEPMSRSSLAKFVFCEAPAGLFDPGVEQSPADEAFRQRLVVEFAGSERPNHVGSLYRSVLDMLAEVSRAPDSPITPEAAAEWHAKILEIVEEGEEDHFRFFRSAYECRHPAFAIAGGRDAWSLRQEDPGYPAHALARNPTAFIGHPNQIESAPALVLAWLGNLHYWIALSSLDYGYRAGDTDAIDLAMTQMMAAIWPIAAALPGLQTGMPFDPLSMGYSLGASPAHSKRFIANLGREAVAFATTIEHRLPSGYDLHATDELIAFMHT
jgi:Ferritin-like